LASLANALKFGTEPEVLAAAKAVNAALQDQVNLAKEKVAKDPKRKRALNQALQAQQGVMKGLLNGTKGNCCFFLVCFDDGHILFPELLGARNGPNAGPKWDTFNLSAEDLAALSQKIADLSDPARAALMFQTPEEIIQVDLFSLFALFFFLFNFGFWQNAMRKVANDMDKLQKGGPDSAEALKAVAAGLNALMGLAKVCVLGFLVSHSSVLPQGRKGKRANAYATAMAGTLGGMLKSGREFLKVICFFCLFCFFKFRNRIPKTTLPVLTRTALLSRIRTQSF
jgi:hypothetical protein